MGRLPPLGYNTWNDLGCKQLTEGGVLSTARALVATGLRDLGYRYVNLDDCWHDPRGRDPQTGRLREDPGRFPSGLRELGDALHRMGLRFGIYTDRGSRTCAGFPGSLGYEELDADTFAKWGVDYVKEDNCHANTSLSDRGTMFQQFGLLRDALNRTGRPMFFSVCGGGDQMPLANLSYYATDPRGGEALANSWRISADCIEWHTCQNAYQIAASLGRVAGPGGFNDPDMLLGSSALAARTLSRARSRTQFGIWAILMAPLLLGSPVGRLDEYDLETYSNTEVLAVNQDALARQGRLLTPVGAWQSVWARELLGGDWALLLQSDNWFSVAEVACDASCWTQLGITSGTAFTVRDLWLHGPAERPVAVAGQAYALPVPPRGASRMLRLSPRAAAAVPAGDQGRAALPEGPKAQGDLHV